MATLTQLIQYQRQCYEADNRETGISSLFHEKHRHVRIFEGEELALSGTLEQIPLPANYSEALQKDTFKFRRDKTLIYGALPIVGKPKSSLRLAKHLCAPLIFFSCELRELKGNMFLRPTLEDARINFPVLVALASDGGADDDAVVEVCSQMPDCPWPKDCVHTVAALLAELLPTVDFTPLASFPQLTPASQLRDLAKDSAGLRCVSAGGAALIPNSPDTRGVLFELSELGQGTKSSQPLAALLGSDASSKKVPRSRPSLAPSVLSNAQQEITRACRTKPVTLVVGPPGTGKSHTIASVALDHIASNQTVLIASRMDQAVNVVGQKIEQLLGPNQAVVRAGRKAHLRELKKSLENLLQGIGAGDEDTAQSARTHFRDLRTLDRRIRNTEDAIHRNHEREISWGTLRESKHQGFFRGIGESMWRQVREWQLTDVDSWEQMVEYEQMLAARNDKSRRFLQAALTERTQTLLKRRREDLSKFLQAIRARSDGKQQKLFSEIDFRVLLHAFPIWLCKLTDLANVLPLKRELFDLAILDEATQCDIASCLPLLQRAKRVAIVGDPKQLRHISFLSETRQATIGDEHQLDASQQATFHYRRQSVLDAASDTIRDQAQVVFLNEHFRSLPQIIGFSNAEFYGNSLSVMRQRPYTTIPNSVEIRPISGKRSRSGRNQIEADAIVSDLAKRMAKSADAQTARQSIGVLSPFREQVEYLSSRLNKHLKFEQMQQHDLLVGTAHTFQGEERDVMYLSLSADDDSHSATFRFLENPNVLNVSITRARHYQMIYLSFDPERLGDQSLLRRWLETMRSPRQLPKGELRSVDAFRNEIVVELQALGYTIWKDYPVAGLEIDLIIESNGNAIGIDLVGYPGSLAAAYTLERYRMLHRSGLHVFPLSFRAWKADQKACLAKIQQALQA